MTRRQEQRGGRGSILQQPARHAYHGCAQWQMSPSGADLHHRRAGGGFGGTTRWAGLGGDNLIALTAVDGKGRIVRADHTKNSDLSGGRGVCRCSVCVLHLCFAIYSIASAATYLADALVPSSGFGRRAAAVADVSGSGRLAFALIGSCGDWRWAAV